MSSFLQTSIVCFRCQKGDGVETVGERLHTDWRKFLAASSKTFLLIFARDADAAVNVANIRTIADTYIILWNIPALNNTLQFLS